MARFSLLRNRAHLGRQTECKIRSKASTACLIKITIEPAKKFRGFQLCFELHSRSKTQPTLKVLTAFRNVSPIDAPRRRR